MIVEPSTNNYKHRQHSSHRLHGHTLLGVLITILISTLFVVSSSAANAKTTPTQNQKSQDHLNTTVTFHVGFQGRPSCHFSNVVSVYLCLNGTNQSSTVPSSCGIFTKDLANGTYYYSIYADKYLANGGSFTVPVSGTVELGTLRGGDANTNNIVNSSDYAIYNAAAGSECGYEDYDSRADFNDDCYVDEYGTEDYDILQSNYGLSGATLCPTSLGPND